MKRLTYVLVAVLTPVFFHSAAAQVAAQTGPLATPLTPAQIQQISGGLFHSSSQDFFDQGNRQLEQETQLLMQHRQLNEGILKISQEINIQRQLNKFERPNFNPTVPPHSVPQQ